MEICRGGDFLFSKNTADGIGSFTAVCVVGVLGAIHCEYRETFVLAMCGIVSFLMYYIFSCVHSKTAKLNDFPEA